MRQTNRPTFLSNQAREEEVARRAEEEKAVEGDKSWPAGKDHTPPKTNMDTQNDVLEKDGKGNSIQTWHLLVSMLDFWGVCLFKFHRDFTRPGPPKR